MAKWVTVPQFAVGAGKVMALLLEVVPLVPEEPVSNDAAPGVGACGQHEQCDARNRHRCCATARFAG